MRKILTDNARYMMKIPKRRYLRRPQRRIIEERRSEYESDDSNESNEESESEKKIKKNKKK